MRSAMLLGHGSPDPAACAEIVEFRELVTARLGAPVGLGVLEFPAVGLPSLGEAFAALARSSRVAAQPLVLFDGLHARRDIPSRAEQAAAALGLDIRLGAVLGGEDALIQLVSERLADQGGGFGDVLLFIGRGSSDERALEQTRAVAAGVALRTGLDHVVCYTGISQPSLAGGMAEALTRRPARVLALPYLLHTGILVRRATEVLVPLAARAGVELVVLAHIGNGPVLVELVARRLEAML